MRYTLAGGYLPSLRSMRFPLGSFVVDSQAPDVRLTVIAYTRDGQVECVTNDGRITPPMDPDWLEYVH